MCFDIAQHLAGREYFYDSVNLTRRVKKACCLVLSPLNYPRCRFSLPWGPTWKTEVWRGTARRSWRWYFFSASIYPRFSLNFIFSPIYLREGCEKKNRKKSWLFPNPPRTPPPQFGIFSKKKVTPIFFVENCIFNGRNEFYAWSHFKNK